MNNIISFSLWGNNPKYIVGAKRNVELTRKHFPGWSCRFYVDEETFNNFREEMGELFGLGGVQLILKDKARDINPLLWRFQVANEKDVNLFLIRDCDSRPSEREKIACEDWLVSGKTYWVCRDHPNHLRPIMGGLWGGKAGKLPDIETTYLDWFEKTGINYEAQDIDQEFLAQVIWPIIKKNCLQHDAFHSDKFPGSIDFPTERKDLCFLGEVWNEGEITNVDCLKLPREEVTLEDKGKFKVKFSGSKYKFLFNLLYKAPVHLLRGDLVVSGDYPDFFKAINLRYVEPERFDNELGLEIAANHVFPSIKKWEPPFIFHSKEEQAEIDKLPDNYIVLDASANVCERVWSNDKWVELINILLTKTKYDIIVIGKIEIAANSRVELFIDRNLTFYWKTISFASYYFGPFNWSSWIAKSCGTPGVILTSKMGGFDSFDVINRELTYFLNNENYRVLGLKNHSPESKYEYTTNIQLASNCEEIQSEIAGFELLSLIQKKNSFYLTLDNKKEESKEYKIIEPENNPIIEASSLFRRGTNDEEIYNYIVNQNVYGIPLKFDKNDIILDIGCHRGYFGEECLKHGAKYVYGYDIEPENVELTQGLWGGSGKAGLLGLNLVGNQLLQASGFCKEGSGRLNTGCSQLLSFPGKVETKLLSDLLAELKVIRLLKININGDELNAISNCDFKGVRGCTILTNCWTKKYNKKQIIEVLEKYYSQIVARPFSPEWGQWVISASN